MKAFDEGTAERHPDLKAKAEQFTKEEPMQALGASAAAGLLFAILPVGRIVWYLLRTSLSLLRPALIVIGAMALYQEISRRTEAGALR
jgi:hypothetical protein